MPKRTAERTLREAKRDLGRACAQMRGAAQTEGSLRVIVIADYGANGGDVAYLKVRDALRGLTRKTLQLPADVERVNCQAFATLEASWHVLTLACSPIEPQADCPVVFRSPGTIYYVNVAPFGTHNKGDKRNEPLYVAVLEEGALVIGPNAGLSYSLFKDRIRHLFRIDTEDLELGQQFRSLYVYPQIFALLLEESLKLDRFHAIRVADAEIPDAPEGAIGTVEGYDNIKLNAGLEAFRGFRPGWYELALDGIGKGHRVFFRGPRGCTFDAKPGDLVLAPGSERIFTGFGKPCARRYELMKFRGSAWKALEQPAIGTVIGLKRLT